MSDHDTEKKPSKKKAKKEARQGARRQERRFIAHSAHNPWLVRVLGGLGATTLGAGSWAYAYGHAFEADEKLKPIPSYLIAAGAVLTGATIWLGTSSETPLRVGDPGISMEKGEVRRMPWWGVSQITFESGNLALVVAGKDESGASWTFKVPVKAHAEAAGWLVKEALDRVPKVVDIADEVLERLPSANPHAGMKIDLEPLQVVGKRDALTGKTISYEPDARVCTRCERVYFKRTVPKKCKCGASLLQLRAQVTQDDPNADDDDDDELEDEDDDDNDESEASEEGELASERKMIMQRQLLAKGMGASPGTATGQIVFRSEDAVAMAAKGTSVILVRTETTPDDVPGMRVAAGIITTRGGITGDAAIVARSLGKPCISSCPPMRVDYAKDCLTVWRDSTGADDADCDIVLAKGTVVTIDGAKGEIWTGA